MQENAPDYSWLPDDDAGQLYDHNPPAVEYSHRMEALEQVADTNQRHEC